MSNEELEFAIKEIVEINKMIVKQNALLVQTLTLPALMVSGEKPGAWTEFPGEKNT